MFYYFLFPLIAKNKNTDLSENTNLTQIRKYTGNKMPHNHSHNHLSDTRNISGKRLLITMSLNFFITIAEIIGGIFAGSLSLISDALHNFSDGIAIIISYIAVKNKEKPSNYLHTFGYKRSEILAAFINSATLIVISFYLFYEAVIRFINPVEVKGGLMITVASIGLIANVIGTLLLKKGSKDNLNLRSAYFHLLSDAFSSAAVILGGVAIYYYDIYWLDPLLTILISIYILKESFSIFKDSTHVLMEGAPKEISLKDIKKEIEAIPQIINIHHVHIWALDEKNIHLEAHINIEDMLVSETGKLLEKIGKVLSEKFKITHFTIQFECDVCKTDELIAME